MKLKEFITIYGPKKLALTLRIDDATVSQWKLAKAFPRPKYLREIVKLSKGQVSYESMVNDYLRRNPSKIA
jgi:DNA-binding transcriptional regulator YdaS (Cro superfamily)